jgi:hypothetical protein
LDSESIFLLIFLLFLVSLLTLQKKVGKYSDELSELPVLRTDDFTSKGGVFFPGVKGDFDPPKVSRILGRKICGNFFAKRLAKNYRIFYDLKFYSPWGGGSKAPFTPEKKSPTFGCEIIYEDKKVKSLFF